MDGALRDQVHSAAERLGGAIFKIEQLESEAGPGSQVIQDINVAVGRSIPSGHRTEDRKL